MSARTVADKLRIAPGMSLWTSHPDRVGLIGPLPEGVRVVDGAAGAGAALVFADDAASLRAVVAAQADGLREREVLWVAYPKGNRADLNRDTLWPILAEHGLRPIGQVSLDDVWSALRFRALAPGEVFRGGAAA
jgi:hypothetical protein